VWGEGIRNYEVGRINRVCGKKFFVGVGVWGVGFYPFSGRSAKLSRAVVNYLSFREKVPNSPPRSLPYLALFDFKKA